MRSAWLDPGANMERRYTLGILPKMWGAGQRTCGFLRSMRSASGSTHGAGCSGVQRCRTAGSLAMLPCQQCYQAFLASACMDKEMLGFISGSVPPEHDVEVFKGEKTTLIPAIKCSEPKK